MKAVILAGGLGTRLSEETGLRPKPMVEIGGKPILWHVMKIYAAAGVTEFIVCVGYRGYLIKEYFANYFLHQSDITVDMGRRSVEYHATSAEPWRVTVVDTGENSNTAGRLKRVAQYLEGEETFYFTYGDGVANVDVRAVHARHRETGADVTVTAVRPPGRFGELRLDEQRLVSFEEKPTDGAWINGGFFVASPRVLSEIAGDASSWEYEVLPALAQAGRVTAYLHRGFWQPMDTLRDKMTLEDLWQAGRAPWKVWP
ncbi:MAG: glucose-1-phosphate cytidylyltransferase [Vulcanimicrobiaceae bacterium]